MSSLKDNPFDGSVSSAIDYSNALRGLSGVQREFVESSLGLTQAQRDSVVSMTNGLDAIKEMTFAEAERSLNLENGALYATLNANATDKITGAVIKELMARKILDDEQVKNLLTTKLQTVENYKQAASYKTLGAAMKSVMIANVSNPLFWLEVAAVTIPLVYKGLTWLYDQIVTTREEYEEMAETAIAEAEENREATESVNRELATTKDRLHELQEISENGALTLVEQEEYDRLVRTNEQLERQLRIRKEIEGKSEDRADEAILNKYQRPDYSIEASDILNEEYALLEENNRELLEAYIHGLREVTEEEAEVAEEIIARRQEIWNQMLTYEDESASFEEYVAMMVERYKEVEGLGKSASDADLEYMDTLRAEMVDVLEELDSDIASYSGNDEGREWLEGLADALDAALYPAEHFMSVMSEFPSTLEDFNEAGSRGSLRAEYVEQAADAYPELEKAMEMCGWTAQDVADHFNAMAVRTDGASDSAEKFAAELKPLSEVLDDVKSVSDVVTKAQEEMAESGNVSNDTIEALAKVTDDYAQYLIIEEGQIRLNIEALNELAEAKQNSHLDKIRDSTASYEQENKLIREQIELLTNNMLKNGPSLAAATEIAELTKTLYENNTAIEENQELLKIWEALFGNVTDEVSGLERAEELLNKSTETISSTLGDLTSTMGSINDTITEYGKKTKLTEQEMTELIAKFPSLINQLTKTEDGYILNVGALENLREAELLEAETMVQAEISKAKAILSSTSQITKAMSAQIQAFSTAAAFMGEYVNAATGMSNAEIMDALQGSGGLDMAHKLTEIMSSDEYRAVQKQAKAIENLNKLIEQMESTDWLSFTGGGGGGGGKIEKYTADIDEFREALRRLNETQERAEDISRRISNSDDLQEQVGLQKILIHAYGQEREALQSLITLRTQSITAGVQSLREMGFAVEYNAKTHDLWISNLEHLNNLTATSIGEYSSMQEATNALRQDTEDLINSLTDLNDENKSGTGEWEDLEASIRDAREEIYGLLEDIVANASASVDSIQEVYDTLHNAADEYAQSGYITVDTLQSIIALGPKYMSLLENENGQLVINEDNIRKVIAARTEQLGIESAMAYVQSLRVAAEADDITTLNNLIYATNDATDATWGLVYANLKLLEIEGKLTGAQYTQALDNINAMRALAENAAANVGRAYDEVSEGSAAEKLVDELNEMKSGIDDIMQYVMDMIRHQVEADIEALEDLKDGYSDIIDLKKESLEASKEEADYQKDMASKIKEIAKLQSQIDALALDDSREAQAKRLSLMEDMAELQEDLNETQADSALDKTLESLDKQEEAYHEEKDREIEKLEETISSQQKLYDMALDHIKNNWGTLLDELRAWNYEYGSSLTSEIESAWDAALAAAQRYGSFVEAMGAIDADIEAAQNAANSSGSSGGMNMTIGKSEDYDGPSDADMIKEIVSKMRMKSSMWSKSNTEEENLALHGEVTFLANELAKYGVGADYDAPTGEWRIVYDRHNPNNVGKLLYSVYHTGGVVGGGDIKANEQLALLKKNEWVLSETMVKNLVAQMDRIEILSRALSETQSSYGRMLSTLQMGTTSPSMVSNIVNNNNRPVEVTFGDTIIHGADRTSVERHVQISREMVNDLARIIGVRK